ncbi:hypothetical protein MRB76_000071 [Shigella flexneri]|nr:hypothetical protein [Shigella flexneri]EIC3923192.1 hypothetical protein [Salmonella enterica]EIZ9552627.1 hypothetical protein [Shigella flexneri]EJR2951862.1 hypothetical protein [Salmonella enterica]
MSQNNIVSIKSIAEAAFAGYPGSLAPMLEKTINKVFDYLESSLQEASLVHDCWVFENTANEAYQHFQRGPLWLNAEPHRFSVTFKLFKERIEIQLVPLNDHIDFEATGLQKVADTAFLQRVELFDMTTVLVIGANPAAKVCKLTHTVNPDGKHCFTSELVSTVARINFI